MTSSYLEWQGYQYHILRIARSGRAAVCTLTSVRSNILDALKHQLRSTRTEEMGRSCWLALAIE